MPRTTRDDDAVVAVGSMARWLFADIPPGEDLVAGLLRIANDQGLRGAAIVSCIGTLDRLDTMGAKPDDSVPSGVGPTEPVSHAGPIQILAGQGFIGRQAGEPFAHLHLVFVTGSGEVRGGHVEVGHNRSLNRLEIGLVIADDLALDQIIDPRTHLPRVTVSGGEDAP